jgi:tetratricopeptide (TPR) repeat protein
MRSFLPYLFIIVLASAGCGGKSDTTMLKQAEKQLQQASVSIHDRDLNKAEQALQQSVELLAAVNNKPKLIEAYTTLASVQVSLGKPSAALSSYTMVRNLYAQGADRNSEIPMMIEIGRLYFQLGMASDAVRILEEALLASQLYQFTKLHAEASLALGTIYRKTGKSQRSHSYFTQSAKEFLELRDTAKIVQALAGKITSLIQSKKIFEAREIYKSLEPLLMKNLRAEYTAEAFSQCGSSFRKSGQTEFARALFANALTTAELSTSERSKRAALSAHIGIGEIYYDAYDFADAQREYIIAYNLQKSLTENAVEAYTLIRIADCNRMQYAVTKPQDAAIRANQLYENALSVFSRMHLGIGEAIALHRIGMLKEIIGDDNAAITYYKRAVEKFSGNDIPLKYLSATVDLTPLISNSRGWKSAADWFTGQLIRLLLHYHRAEEAMKYSMLRSSYDLTDKISLDEVAFRQSDRQHSLDQFLSVQKKIRTVLLEQYYAASAKNKVYGDQLAHQRAELEKQLNAQPQPPIPWYVKTGNSASTLWRLMDPALTVLQYQMIEGECWVTVMNSEGGISAHLLAVNGYELKKKMERYISLIAAKKTDENTLSGLSDQLYSILLLPVEQYGKQRFVIIPFEGIEKFPFHTLTKNGRPLLDMIEISYLPSPSMLRTGSAPVRTIDTVAAFGFPSDSRWGLEFELRDIRSFFRNTEIALNQNATQKNLETATGDLLQLSSPFRSTADNDFFVTLSDGSFSPAGVTVPISMFASLYPFNAVYLSDVQSKANNIDIAHTLYWMMNGASAVITTEFPIDSRTGKLFEENFYAALPKTTPYQAYRSAVLEFGNTGQAASYFYNGF